MPTVRASHDAPSTSSAVVACLEVDRIDADPVADALARRARQLGFDQVTAITCTDLLFVAGELGGDDRRRLADALVADPLLVTYRWRDAARPDAPDRSRGAVVETTLHPGVTDATAAEVIRAAGLLQLPVTGAATGRRFTVDGDLTSAQLEDLAHRVLANPVIEQWCVGEVAPPFFRVAGASAVVETIALRELDADGLAALSAERGLALDPEEHAAVQTHFASLGRDPTDAELEMLAQTWSEHCAHKTFRAAIATAEGEAIVPLMTQLRSVTDSIAATWVRSAFVGNAGIVDFDDAGLLAVKVETHNHPSAIEPFGGANTGVGGVVRDVLAASARPIAATDVLCFGPLDTPNSQVPDGSLHPLQVFDGVVAGVADYGNKIGVPTVAGAVLHDPGYTANPLVFCGCVGLVPPHALAPLTGPHRGDRVVVIGGRTGRDGLRGATFSSMTMDATTGEVAGASVQIGAPIVEKLVADALVALVGCYSAITDCGAGGLSSAVGEMAETTGATVDLALVPLKYDGLAPWEVWLSEAQERMVLAVAPSQLDGVSAVCDRHGVECTDIGEFTGDGLLRVCHGSLAVVELATSFLHDGRPQRRMTAELPVPDRGRATAPRAVDDVTRALLGLLAHPTIASKEAIIRRYDHEVQGRTIVRPLVGVVDDGPADGVVLADPRSKQGFAIGIGVNPWFGAHDPYRMAMAVVDEAIRNAVVAGADPDRIALLDNFSWGDPRRPATLGGLAEAVRGCCAAALAHRAPFVSGKDSLNNEYLGIDGERHSVPPTLVITALGHVPDADAVVTPDLKTAGDLLVLLGATRDELRASHLDLLLGVDGGGPVPEHDADAPARYRTYHRALRRGLIRSAHDCAEGGVAVSVAEMCIGGWLGAEVTLPAVDDPVVALFAESLGRIVVAVRPADLDELLVSFGTDAVAIGVVTAAPKLTIVAGSSTVSASVAELRTAWAGDQP